MFASHGQVNSKITTTPVDSFMIKISGLRLVTMIFGGTEPPPGARNPGISEYRRVPGVY